MQEFDLIGRLAQRLQAKRCDTRQGLGDDAAVITPPPGHDMVVTTDTLVAGRHFPDDAVAFDIGFKSLAVSLSDVAAMGATPAWATIALTTPELESSWCETFMDGAVQAIGNMDVDIMGGDTTSGPLSITGTVHGLVPAGQAVKRSGARPGDLVCVTGTLGDAALGLRLWNTRKQIEPNCDIEWLHGRLNRPQWRNGAALAGVAHATIDLSDGLLADLGHILTASGCGAHIDASRLPSSRAFDTWCPAMDRNRLQLAGGDDYELCVVLPESAYSSLAQRLDCTLTPIGEIRKQKGFRVEDADGRPLPVSDFPGWDHFR